MLKDLRKIYSCDQLNEHESNKSLDIKGHILYTITKNVKEV